MLRHITILYITFAFYCPDRQVLIDKVDGQGDNVSAQVHNSLTFDGLSMPTYPKIKKAILLGRDGPQKEEKVLCIDFGVVTRTLITISSSFEAGGLCFFA